MRDDLKLNKTGLKLNRVGWAKEKMNFLFYLPSQISQDMLLRPSRRNFEPWDLISRSEQGRKWKKNVRKFTKMPNQYDSWHDFILFLVLYVFFLLSSRNRPPTTRSAPMFNPTTYCWNFEHSTHFLSRKKFYFFRKGWIFCVFFSFLGWNKCGSRSWWLVLYYIEWRVKNEFVLVLWNPQILARVDFPFFSRSYRARVYDSRIVIVYIAMAMATAAKISSIERSWISLKVER